MTNIGRASERGRERERERERGKGERGEREGERERERKTNIAVYVLRNAYVITSYRLYNYVGWSCSGRTQSQSHHQSLVE